MHNLTGKLLVASPHLSDKNFFRSVVLILRHASSDAFGLVLNRPTDFRLSESLEDLKGVNIAKEANLFWGGPVEGPLMAIHQDSMLADFAAVGGVFATMDELNLLKLISRGDAKCRYFVGYSGWGKGQLDAELNAGGWLLSEMSIDDVFGDSEVLWEAVVQRVGRNIMGSLVTVGNDFDPSSN